MGKQKKQKKRRPAISLTLSPAEEKQVHELIQNIRGMDPAKIKEDLPTPLIARAFLERLPADTPEAIDIIKALSETYDQKEVRKALKKAIFKLKSRGVAVPDLATVEDEPFHIKTEDVPEPTAYLGPVDGTGNRAVFLAIPRIPKGVDVGLGIVSDEQGILHFMFGQYSKKRMNEVKTLFFEEAGLMVQTSPPHAARVLETAYQRNSSSVDEGVQGYLQLRPWILANAAPLEQSPIYQDISPDDITSDLLTESRIEKLLEHELMVSWFIGPADIKPVIDRIKEAEESRILVSDDQKRGRIKDIAEKAVEELFPEQKRLILKNRLEEMAYVFHQLAQEDFTRISLAAARSLEQRDTILGVNAFLKAMIERSLDLYAQIERAGESKVSDEKEAGSRPKIIVP